MEELHFSSSEKRPQARRTVMRFHLSPPTLQGFSPLKIYFFLTEREHAHTSRGSSRQREREKQTPPLSMELDVGLDPRTP